MRTKTKYILHADGRLILDVTMTIQVYDRFGNNTEYTSRLDGNAQSNDVAANLKSMVRSAVYDVYSQMLNIQGITTFSNTFDYRIEDYAIDYNYLHNYRGEERIDKEWVKTRPAWSFRQYRRGGHRYIQRLDDRREVVPFQYRVFKYRPDGSFKSQKIVKSKSSRIYYKRVSTLQRISEDDRNPDSITPFRNTMPFRGRPLKYRKPIDKRPSYKEFPH